MRNKTLVFLMVFAWSALVCLSAVAQDEGYKFTIDKELPRTPVKSQVGGTCWCYATVSFVESEVLRTQGKELDLSEMYIVCKLIPEKAEDYVRLGGKTRVGDGGLAHHVFEPWKKYGLMPNEVFPHVSVSRLYSELTTMLDERVKSRGGYTPEFAAKVDELITKHVGVIPDKFEFEGKEYTPKTFAEEVVQLNPDDYVEITSYTHHPFYEQFRLEIPDNWDFEDDFYNVPLDEMEQIIDASIASGYTVLWDGDVGARGKVRAPSVYHVPVEGPEGEKLPAKQQVITQEIRQHSFDTFSTTDVHLMHLVGVAHDQIGQKFYLIKNSHGARGAYDGNVYMAQSFLRLDTTSMAVNRNAIPEEIRQKMGIRIGRGRGGDRGGRIR